MNAVGGMTVQPGVMLPQGGGHFGLHHRQIVIFIHHRDIDSCGAGLAVSAIGALAMIGMQRSRGDDGRVVLFLI